VFSNRKLTQNHTSIKKIGRHGDMEIKTKADLFEREIEPFIVFTHRYLTNDFNILTLQI